MSDKSGDVPPPDECTCGGYIAWLDEGDSWGGSCYGQCGDYPRVPKSNPSDSIRKRTEQLLADHATTYFDQDGDPRCDCGKWLEPGEHEWPTHVAWMLDDARLLADDNLT